MARKHRTSEVDVRIEHILHAHDELRTCGDLCVAANLFLKVFAELLVHRPRSDFEHTLRADRTGAPPDERSSVKAPPKGPFDLELVDLGGRRSQRESVFLAAGRPFV